MIGEVRQNRECNENDDDSEGMMIMSLMGVLQLPKTDGSSGYNRLILKEIDMRVSTDRYLLK